ncbi:hypothetical protein SAMD00019534_066770 [Acytostelium subglobosum LB1]|uniref:hypothetical protein n=1 Tax=Acytostelium subglobosum LB1 TaxID=1410327 RepID=UPI000644A7C9|nr:hypothetical protein SAMD00019534_066770 [Acytostelium subglobosum LB1]GAM23502.1 hypothetical protein SAMD00019534_066770 [Acytostelium subglobosum LB1]|eukprot:XP_012753243.1 hypothetical protein SAMD00019534_066770 [Acytostelium subglobosum LB1]
MAEYKGGEGDGMRIRMFEKKRENEMKELNKMKEKLKEEAKNSVVSISQKFESGNDANNVIKTGGLVSMNEFNKQTNTASNSSSTNEKNPANDKKREAAEKADQQRKKKKQMIAKNTLSFDMDEEEQEEEEQKHKEKKTNDTTTVAPSNGESSATDEQPTVAATSTGTSSKPKMFGKNPLVNTDFLPDQEREEFEQRERDRLARIWTEEQEKIKAEVVEITYSYWDGSGHRRQLQCNKGTTIDKFLERVRQEFKELRGVTVDHMMFIKEDLIIPHNYSFYDLIVEKARGKSGPLFKFDVHDDVRLVSDASVEKDETHAAKVVEKSWYDKNKHIFPASRWEVYDPTIVRQSYTISDKLTKH